MLKLKRMYKMISNFSNTSEIVDETTIFVFTKEENV